MRVFYGNKLIIGVTTLLLIVFLSLFARMLSAAEQAPATDPSISRKTRNFTAWSRARSGRPIAILSPGKTTRRW